MRTPEGHSVRQRASTVIRLVSDISGANNFSMCCEWVRPRNDLASHSRRRQHMMVPQAKPCKIDYGDRSAIPSEPPSLARLSAALASDGGGEGWPIPLMGLSIVRRLRNSNLASVSCDRGATGSGPSSFPASTRCHHRHAEVR